MGLIVSPSTTAAKTTATIGSNVESVDAVVGPILLRPAKKVVKQPSSDYLIKPRGHAAEIRGTSLHTLFTSVVTSRGDEQAIFDGLCFRTWREWAQGASALVRARFAQLFPSTTDWETSSL